MANQNVYCTGSVLDYETVTAVLAWNVINSQWTLTCP